MLEAVAPSCPSISPWRANGTHIGPFLSFWGIQRGPVHYEAVFYYPNRILEKGGGWVGNYLDLPSDWQINKINITDCLL